jgi:hypothetical protein
MSGIYKLGTPAPLAPVDLVHLRQADQASS